MKHLLFLIATIFPSIFFAQTISIDLELQNFKADKGGQLMVGLFESEDEFAQLEKPVKSYVVCTSKVNQGKLKLDNIKPGNYAISIFHDKNANGKLDKNFLGIPKESYGFSNNPPSTFGPPKFEKSRIEIQENAKVSIKLN